MIDNFKKAIELEDLTKQYKKLLTIIKGKKISPRISILDEDTGMEWFTYVKPEFIIEMLKQAEADIAEEYEKIMQKIKRELR